MSLWSFTHVRVACDDFHLAHVLIAITLVLPGVVVSRLFDGWYWQ